MYPIFNLSVPYGIVYAITCLSLNSPFRRFPISLLSVPGPLAAVEASSPMKKSKSSVPLFADSAPPCPVPPVRKEGLFATAGLPDPEPPEPPAAPFVAIAVGKTKDGESLPAKPDHSQCGAKAGSSLRTFDEPSLENPVPLVQGQLMFTSCIAGECLLVHDNGRSLGRHYGQIPGARKYLEGRHQSSLHIAPIEHQSLSMACQWPKAE